MFQEYSSTGQDFIKRKTVHITEMSRQCCMVKRHCDVLSCLNKIEYGNGNMNKRRRKMGARKKQM